MTVFRTMRGVGALACALLLQPLPLMAQGDGTAPLRYGDFLAEVLSANPRLHAATDRATGLSQTAQASGAMPDPTLMLGVSSLPIASPNFRDEMTMKQIGITQMVPFPGKRALEREAASHRVTAGEAAVSMTRNAVRLEAATAWAELSLLDAKLEILRRRRDLLVALRDAAESAYRAGTSGQDAVWQSRIELSEVALEATELAGGRRTIVATLNALRAQPAETPIGGVAVPSELLAALGDSSVPLRFESDSLGAPLIDAGVPSLDSLVAWALSSNPDIAEHVARLAEQGAMVALARTAARPDVEISVMYEQRDRMPDFLSATVGIPLAIRPGRVQHRRLEAATLELEAQHAEHDQMLREITAQLVGFRAEARRARTTLAILQHSVIPEQQAALKAAQAGFAAGRSSFMDLIEAEQSLYAADVRRHEQLTAFMIAVAHIEAVVGREIF